MQFSHIAVLVLAALADVRAAPSAVNALPRRDSQSDASLSGVKPATRPAPMAFFHAHNQPDEDDEEEVYIYHYKSRPAARRIHWHSHRVGAAAAPALMRMVAQRRTSRY